MANRSKEPRNRKDFEALHAALRVAAKDLGDALQWMTELDVDSYTGKGEKVLACQVPLVRFCAEMRGHFNQLREQERAFARESAERDTEK